MKINSLTELYNNLKNPFSNGDFLKDMVNHYVKRDGSIYNFMTSSENQNKGTIDEVGYVNFANKMFDSWKQKVLTESDDSRKTKLYKDYDKLVQYINHLPSFKSVRDIQSARDDIEGYYLQPHRSAYWQHDGHGFIYYNSKGLTAGQFKTSSEETNRLYLNIRNDSLYAFADLFIEQCKKNNLPYSFKFIEDGTNRDDAVVFYTDNKIVLKTIEIIQTIQEQNPQLFDPNLKAPKSVAPIFQNLGFADEPEAILNNDVSYNEKLEIIIQNSLSKIVLKKVLERIQDDYFKNYAKDIVASTMINKLMHSAVNLSPKYAQYTKEQKNSIYNAMVGQINNYCENNLDYIIKTGLSYLSSAKDIIPGRLAFQHPEKVLTLYLGKGTQNEDDVKVSLVRSDFDHIAQIILKNSTYNDTKIAEQLFADIKDSAAQYKIDSEKFIIFEKPNGLKSYINANQNKTNDSN